MTPGRRPWSVLSHQKGHETWNSMGRFQGCSQKVQWLILGRVWLGQAFLSCANWLSTAAHQAFNSSVLVSFNTEWMPFKSGLEVGGSGCRSPGLGRHQASRQQSPSSCFMEWADWRRGDPLRLPCLWITRNPDVDPHGDSSMSLLIMSALCVNGQPKRMSSAAQMLSIIWGCFAFWDTTGHSALAECASVVIESCLLVLLPINIPDKTRFWSRLPAQRESY